MPECFGWFDEYDEYCCDMCPFGEECEYITFEEELDSYYNDNFMR